MQEKIRSIEGARAEHSRDGIKWKQLTIVSQPYWKGTRGDVCVAVVYDISPKHLMSVRLCDLKLL